MNRDLERARSAQRQMLAAFPLADGVTVVDEATLLEAAERKSLSSNPADLPAEVRERMRGGVVQPK